MVRTKDEPSEFWGAVQFNFLKQKMSTVGNESEKPRPNQCDCIGSRYNTRQAQLFNSLEINIVTQSKHIG